MAFSRPKTQLVELLWAYDEEKATKWLIRSIDNARHPNNFFYNARIATEKALDFELTAKCLEEGFNVIWKNFSDGDDCEGLYSPKEWALKIVCSTKPASLRASM